MDKKVIRLEHSNPIHNKIVVVSWIMGNVCNFSCPYCSETVHNGSKKWPNYTIVKSFIDKVCGHYMKNNTTVYFDLNGGEITLNKDLFKIIDYLNQKKCWVGLVSNGSQNIDYWNKIKSNIDHICLSFHPLSTKKEHFIHVVETLHKEVATHINIMMEANSFELCSEVGQYLCARIKNITLSYQPLVKMLFQDDRLFEYSHAQIEEIIRLEKQVHIEWSRKLKTYRGKMKEVYEDGIENEISTPELLASGKNDWTGWECWAGLEQLAIDPNGSIYRAWCKQDKIGAINDENIAFPNESTICRTNNCFCQLDLASTKRKQKRLNENNHFENTIMNKPELSFKEINWAAVSDNSSGGNSIATIIEKTENGLTAQLAVQSSSLNYYFARVSFPWKFTINYLVKGLIITMDLDKGKILTLQFPLQTNKDFDSYQTQILGEGEKEYIIDFNKIRQQGFGTAIEWDARKLKEIQFDNEYIRNNINIKIMKIHLIC